MNKNISIKDVPYLLISFFAPFFLFYFTSSNSLMFDDSGEFALNIKLAGLAHPPGTPAYILIGHLWTCITNLFNVSTILSATIFSGLCIALSSVFLYLIFKTISGQLADIKYSNKKILCCFAAISFATANTTWSWANTIEVYSFQVLAMSIALFGLFNFHFSRKSLFLVIAALGIGLGLSNHHVTMIFFLPFTLIFFTHGLFSVPELQKQKKKNTPSNKKSLISELTGVFKMKQFWLLVSLTTGVTLFFYGWLFIRAQSEFPFMFGKPSTLSELFYHVRGGSYTKNISSTSSDVISSRLPYFIKLTALQLFIFIPFFINGIVMLTRNKHFRIMWTMIFYFMIIFMYQVNNNQWGSTDAYMLLPFVMLSIITFYGIIYTSPKLKVQFILPVLIIFQVAYFYSSHDRKNYSVSKSLMTLLDESAPQNSIVVIADWSLIIQYYYYRIVENFRPDLIVINYDIKFTHYRILPLMYPEFYKTIQPVYDRFIDELSKEHPHQVNNTGCDLSTPQLTESFRQLLSSIETIAKNENRFLLTDPRAHNFYMTQKLYDPRRYVSGCFCSSKPGTDKANDTFINMNLPFLKSPVLYNDAGTLDKLVDFQAMLDSHVGYYSANNDSVRLAKAENAHDYIIRLQRDMKKSMSFAFKVK